MFLQFIYAFFATLSFSILFQVEKKHLFFCGLNGAFGWLIYIVILNLEVQPFVATFFSAILITFFARVFANLRRTPITIFLITGVIPLVPGSYMYYTILNIISHNDIKAAVYALDTLKIAGAIALGVILILSLPNKLFIFKYKN